MRLACNMSILHFELIKCKFPYGFNPKCEMTPWSALSGGRGGRRRKRVHMADMQHADRGDKTCKTPTRARVI